MAIRTLTAAAIAVTLGVTAVHAQWPQIGSNYNPNFANPMNSMPQTNAYGQPMQRFSIPTPQYQPLQMPQQPQQLNCSTSYVGNFAYTHCY